VTDTFAYKAYGELLSHVGPSGARHRFAGEETDLESGLTYLRARYYDPRTGAFLTRDPADGNPYDPLTLHPYSYASGNPVNRTDPSGRETLLETLNVQSIQTTNEKYEQIVKVRDGIEKTKKVVAAVMRDAGAILAVEALVEATQNDDLVLKWFGGFLGLPKLGARPRGLNLAGLAAASPSATGASSFFGIAESATETAIKIGAELALAKGAYDMFNRMDVTIGIQVVPAGLGAPVEVGELTTEHRTCAAHPDWHAAATKQDSGWSLALCTPFFSDSPLPKDVGGVSMAGVMVHEFMHITSDRLIRDEAYNCSEVGFNPAKPGALKLKNLVPGKTLFNADSYRCWVEESAIGIKKFQ
jgi:RHS repeat-associated protein